MAGSGCIFTDYGLPILYGSSALLAWILLRACGGKRLTCGEYFFGVWNFVAFTMHATLDAYFLYTPRLLPKSPTETAPKPDDIFGCYTNAVRKMWLEFADADTRMFMDEYQPLIRTLTYGAAIGGTALTFLAFLGHLCGGKWAHGMQIAAGTWHIGLIYGACFPEYLLGFTHVKNMQLFAIANLPFVIFPALAILSSLCKLCCGSGPCGSVCPVAPSATGHATHTEKKKKQ